MHSRDVLIAAVQEHNGQAGCERDSVGYLTIRGVRDAADLAAATDPDNDFAAAYLLGWFHWSRFQALPDAENQDDLASAVRFFAPVYAAEPHAVPEEIHERYKEPEPAAAAPSSGAAGQNTARATGTPTGGDPVASSRKAAETFGAYARSGNLDLLKEAIAHFRAAVAACPVGHPDRAGMLSSLGALLQTLFERTGEADILQEALDSCREAAAGTPIGHPNYARIQSILGTTLRIRYERTGDRAALTHAVTAGRAALNAAPLGHPQRAGIASNLVGALLLSSVAGDAGALTEAVEAGRAAAAAALPGSPDRPGILANLGIALQVAYTRSGDVELLMESVRVLKDAAATAVVGDPERADHLTNLGAASLLLFKDNGDISVLREAVEAGRAAVNAAPAGSPSRGKYLVNLANALKELADRTGENDPLTEAVDISREAIGALRPGHGDRAKAQSVLGAALRVRSSRDGDLDAQRQAVESLKAAVAGTRPASTDHAIYLSNLGNALRDLFVRTGERSALTEAVEVGRAAVAATPPGSVNAAAHISNLGVTLRILHGRTHDVETLREAVTVHRDAVAAAPTGHPKRPQLLSNLGNVLRALYQQTGETDLLTEAVDILQGVVTDTPTGHPDRVSLLTNLGVALLQLAHRTRDVGVIRRAVEVCRAAVAATPVGRLERAKHLSNLGSALQILYGVTGDSTVQTEAVAACRSAVAAVPADHPDLALYQSNLGHALQRLAENSPDGLDIRVLIEAVDTCRAAATGTPDDHPDRSVRLLNLGHGLRMLADHTGDPLPLAEARICFQQSAGNTAAPVEQRINASCELATLEGRTAAGAADALTAIETAIGLLPQLAPRALIRPDREHRVSLLADLAGQAAAAAVGAGRPERAVELLEQTRGVLVADVLDARSSDVTRLREQAPELAQSFDELRTRLDVLDQTELSGSPGGGDQSGADDAGPLRRAARELAAERRDAHAEWRRLLKRIRALTGFETFLQPPEIADLAAHAENGPVVLVYGHQTRCDALILRADPRNPVQVVPLTGLDSEVVGTHASRLLAAREVTADGEADPAARIAAQAEIRDVLAWLWDTVAGPVLAALGIASGPDGAEPDWPRLWWCPVGVFAHLPLHAAGHHTDVTDITDITDPNDDRRAAPRTVLDRAVSSYTPTIRGLAYARGHRPDPSPGTTVIIAVPNAPDAEPLPGAAEEAVDLAALIPGARVLPDPRRPDVLAALRENKIAHFACHGEVDWDNPAASRLLLGDHLTEPLTVAGISALRLTSGLAFLSACSTAVTSPLLSNEAVHITGAFHLAGYQHVVGTLWPIADEGARDLAVAFYTDLTNGGGTPPDTGRSARVLHDVTRRLRDRYLYAPTLWAAHTHTGT